MENFKPVVEAYAELQVIGYPSSLEVFNVDGHIWRWNASCWMYHRPLGPREIWAIVRHIKDRLGFAPQRGRNFGALQLGSDDDPRDGGSLRYVTYIVFPMTDEADAYNSGFGACSERLMQQWTDEVMIPALDCALLYGDGSRTAPVGSYCIIRLNSQAAQVEGGQNVSDTPILLQIRWDELKSLWVNMQAIVAEQQLNQFEGMFLVLVAGHPDVRMGIVAGDAESFWDIVNKIWFKDINMGFLPADTLDITARVTHKLQKDQTAV